MNVMLSKKGWKRFFRRLRYTLFFLCVFLISGRCLLQAQDIGSINKQNWFDVSGNVGLNFSFSDYGNQSNAMQSPWSYGINAGLNLRLVGIDIPLSFAYANGQRSFSHPFVHYGISPRYKWITLHVGYRSLSLSPTIFTGKTFLGVGTEIHWRWLRFSAFYGNLERSQGYDALNGNAIPSFGRLGMGAKLGLGTKNTFLDIIVFKAKDDSTSIAPYPKMTITPQDNLVAGLHAGIKLFKVLTIRSEWSVSGYTKNMSGLSIPDPVIDKLSSFLAVRANSRVGFVTNNTLSLQFGKFGIQGGYRMVTADYMSLGVPGMGKNTRSISANARATLLDGRLNLTGFLSDNKSNLTKRQMYTNRNRVYGVNFSAVITDVFSIDGSYSGLHSFQEDGTAKVNDSIRLNMFTHSINVSPDFVFGNATWNHNIGSSFDYSTVINTNDLVDYIENTLNLSCMTSYALTYLPLDLSGGANYTFTYDKTGMDISNSHVVGIFASKRFLKAKNLSLNVSSNVGTDSYGGVSRTTFSLSGGVRYTLFNDHHFSFSTSFSTFTADGGSGRHSFRGTFSYNYNIPPLSSRLARKQQQEKK